MKYCKEGGDIRIMGQAFKKGLYILKNDVSVCGSVHMSPCA